MAEMALHNFSPIAEQGNSHQQQSRDNAPDCSCSLTLKENITGTQSSVSRNTDLVEVGFGLRINVELCLVSDLIRICKLTLRFGRMGIEACLGKNLIIDGPRNAYVGKANTCSSKVQVCDSHYRHTQRDG